MKHLESSESALMKSQNDRLSPEIPHESSENLQVLARVCDVETTVAGMAHLAISMAPHGPRACRLLPRL